MMLCLLPTGDPIVVRTSDSAVLLVPKDLLQEVTNAQVWQIEVPEGRQPGDSLPCVPNFLELEIFGVDALS